MGVVCAGTRLSSEHRQCEASRASEVRGCSSGWRGMRVSVCIARVHGGEQARDRRRQESLCEVAIRGRPTHASGGLFMS